MNSKMKYEELQSCLSDADDMRGTTFGQLEDEQELEAQDSNALTDLMDKWITLLSIEGKQMGTNGDGEMTLDSELLLNTEPEALENDSIKEQLDYCTKHNINPKFWVASDGFAKGVPTLMEMVSQHRLFKYHAAMRLYLKVEMEVENKKYSYQVGTRRIKAHFDEQYRVVLKAREDLKKRLSRQTGISTQPWEYYLSPFSS